MAFSRLATLLVDIVINTRRFQTVLNQTLNQTKNAAQSMRSSLTSIGLAASGILLVKKAFDIVFDSVKEGTLTFAKLEKQIVDIQKVARFKDSGFSKGFIELGQNLRGVRFDQLAEIGGDLARLGIRGGSKEFLEFLEVAANLAQATGDIDSRQAGEGLGKLLQNFGKNLNAAEAAKMASSMNMLADSFAVTSGEILTVTQKVSGFADAVGLTAQETMGLVTLIKQTGISSTVVESSLTRLFTVLESEPRKVGQVLGLTQQKIEEFVVQLQTKPIEAIRTFFAILNSMPIDQAVGILKKLELATSRNAVAILNATNRFKDWNNTQQTAIKGSQDLSNFFAKVAEGADTAAGRIDQLSNRWEVFKTNFGNTQVVGVLNELLKGLNENTNDIAGSRKPLPTNLEGMRAELIALSKKREELFKIVDRRLSIGQTISSLGVSHWTAASTLADITKIEEREKAISKILVEQNIARAEAKKQAKDTVSVADKHNAVQNRLYNEYMKNRDLFKSRGFGLMEEPTEFVETQNRILKRAKEEKELYTGKGAAEIHAKIDLEATRRIALEKVRIEQETADKLRRIAREQRDDFLEGRRQMQAAFDLIKSHELKFLKFSEVGLKGTTGEKFDNLLRFGESLKSMGQFGPNKDAKMKMLDLIMNPVQTTVPEIMGLDAAFNQAITQQDQDGVDERAAKFLEQMTTLMVEDKDVQKEIRDLIKNARVVN